MPTPEEFLDFFHLMEPSQNELKYYQDIGWDPRKHLMMKVNTVKAKLNRENRRTLTGNVGRLALIFYPNVACNANEWETVKANYTALLTLERAYWP